MSKTNELEKLANKTNIKLRQNNIALIMKVPVPIMYTAKGLVAQASTVDYTGLILGGKYVAFDAKECQSKTSFPLANIHQHQLLYLELVQKLGGLAFFMIHLKTLYPDKVFITPISLVQQYWYKNNSNRKSIPVKDFQDRWLTDINDYIDKIKEIENELF